MKTCWECDPVCWAPLPAQQRRAGVSDDFSSGLGTNANLEKRSGAQGVCRLHPQLSWALSKWFEITAMELSPGFLGPVYLCYLLPTTHSKDL